MFLVLSSFPFNRSEIPFISRIYSNRFWAILEIECISFLTYMLVSVLYTKTSFLNKATTSSFLKSYTMAAPKTALLLVFCPTAWFDDLLRLTSRRLILDWRRLASTLLRISVKVECTYLRMPYLSEGFLLVSTSHSLWRNTLTAPSGRFHVNSRSINWQA